MEHNGATSYDWRALAKYFEVIDWVGLHSYGLLRQEQAKGLARLGFAFSGLPLLTVLVGWFFLMQGQQILHTVDEAVGLLFLVWLGLLSWRCLKGAPSAAASSVSAPTA